MAARVHADSQGVWHLIDRTADDGSHRSYCGRELDAWEGSPWHSRANGVVEAEAVPVVDRCLACARIGRWHDAADARLF